MLKNYLLKQYEIANSFSKIVDVLYAKNMASKIPKTLTELAQMYGFSEKYISNQYKQLAYNPSEPKPKRLRLLTPKRVVVFIQKFGTPNTDLPN